MTINAVYLVACLLASVAPAAVAEQHLVDSPVLMKILKTVDEAPTDEHLLDVTLRLLKGICECMTETLLVKQKPTNHADTSTTWMDDGTRHNTTWKELDLYQKIYNNTCFNLRNELAVKVDVDQLERTKNENDTQSLVKMWNCGKQHEITTERIVMTSTSMSPVLDDSLKSKLENILFKTLIVTKDYHTYKLRRRNLFGRYIPIARNKKKHSIIVIVTLHPMQIIPRNRKVLSENFGSLSGTNKYKLDEIELNQTIYSKSDVDIDIFDTDFNLMEKESDENNTNVVSKCVLLSIYKFLTESETNNHTKVFKLLRRKKSIKIYIEVMTSQGDGSYSRMCCDGDAIKPSCMQQYVAKHLDINEGQGNDQTGLKIKPILKIEENNSDYKDTIAKIKNLLKLYDHELQKSTYYGKRVVVDNKLEGPKHGSHVGGDARVSVIDVFAKHKSVADHVTKSTNIDKVEFATQLFSTTAPTIQNVYTFKGFYDDELWDNTIPQETKNTDSTTSFSKDDNNEFQNPVPVISNVHIINVKKEPSNKEYVTNFIRGVHVLPKVRTTRSTAIEKIQNDTAFEKLSSPKVNHESTDQIRRTLNAYPVVPLNYSFIQSTNVKTSTEYSKDDKGSKIASFQEGSNLSETTKTQYPENMSSLETRYQKSNRKHPRTNKNIKYKIIVNPMAYSNKPISKVRLDFDTETMKNYYYETSTQFNYNNIDNNSQGDMNSDKKYKHAIINSNTKTIPSQQFANSKKINDTTTEEVISKESLQIETNETSTHLPDAHSGLIAITEPPAEYVDFSSGSEEKHVNNSIIIRSRYDGNKHLPVNLFKSLIPLDSIITFNNISENVHFTTDYKALVEQTTKASVKLSGSHKNYDVSEKYDSLLENLTGSSLSLHNTIEKKSQDHSKISHHQYQNAQTIKILPKKNMKPIVKLVDINLPTTEDIVAPSITENYVMPNPKNYNKDNFEFATIPVIVVSDINTSFEVNTDKLPQTDESDSKNNLAKSEGLNLVNSYVDTELESINKTPIHLRDKSYFNVMDNDTSNTEYINTEKLEFITEKSGIKENTNKVDIIEEKLKAINSRTETFETTTNSKVLDRDYSMTTCKNCETITRNGNEKESGTISESNNEITIISEKPETSTENIKVGLDNKNTNDVNSYDTTVTTFITIEFTTQRTESASVISTEDLEEHTATTKIETPKLTRDGSQMNYLEQFTDRAMDNDFVEAPESHTFGPMSLKKEQPLVVYGESNQIVELDCTTEKYTAGRENLDKVLEVITLSPIFPTNVQPLLKNTIGKRKNDAASADEEVIINNEDEVQASESHTSTSITPLNVKPLQKEKNLNKFKLTAATTSIAPEFSKGSQINSSVADELLVPKEFVTISMIKHEKSTTMKTLLQDTEPITSSETQDIEVLASTIAPSAHTTATTEYLDHSVGSREKHINKSFQIYSTKDHQNYSSVKDYESLIPVEPMTVFKNYASNVNFETSAQNVEENKTNYSVPFANHPENIDLTEKHKILLENLTGAYISNNKSQDLTENLHAIISSTTKTIANKKSKAYHQVSEFDVPSLNVEPLVTHTEETPMTTTEKKITVTDKDLANDFKSYTITQTLPTNVQHLENSEDQQNNKLTSINDEKTDINEIIFPASVFHATVVSTTPANVKPLFTPTTDKLVNGSISTSSMNVTLNEDLVQPRTENIVESVPLANNSKDSVESVLEKLYKTGTINTTPGKDSTLFYTEAALLYTTTSNPMKSIITSMLTSTQTTLSVDEEVTKKNYASDKRIKESKTHTTPLNLSTETHIREDKIITSTIGQDAAMENYYPKQNNFTAKSLESDIEETLFNEIEKEESAENNKKIKEDLSENTLDETSETTQQNSINQFHSTTTPNLEISTADLFTVKTKSSSSRGESVSVSGKENNLVEMLITSTSPTFSERISSTETTITKINFKTLATKLKENIENELLASRISDTSKLVTNIPDHLEIATIHALNNSHVIESDKTTNDIAAPNLDFRPGYQQSSYHEYDDNITKLIENREKPTLSLNYNESAADNKVIISKTKQSTELKTVNISDNTLNKIITNDNAYSKNQENENINQEKQKVNNQHSELNQQLHQTPQKNSLFIKNSKNSQIKATHFYPEEYNHISLKQDTVTEKITLQLRSTSSISNSSYVQNNSNVSKIKALKNDKTTSYDDLFQHNDTNSELGGTQNELEFPLFTDEEDEDMNKLSTLTLKETTRLMTKNEQIILKEDIEQESSTKFEIQSNENIFEYTGSTQYQETPFVEPTVISEENSLTTIENNLFEVETLKYPITINSNVNEVIMLPQETYPVTLTKIMKQSSDTKEQEIQENKSDNTELSDQEGNTAYSKSTLIPLIMIRNTQGSFKDSTEQGNKTMLEIRNNENEFEYRNLNEQISETLLTLATSTPEEITVEMNPEVNKLTTLANKNEQAALKYYFEQSTETEMDFKTKGNQFDFTDLKNRDDKSYNLSTFMPKKTEDLVEFKVNDLTTLRNVIPATLRNYNEQYRDTKEFEVEQNESLDTYLKKLDSEIAEKTWTPSIKNVTAAISAKLVKNLYKIGTTTNAAIETNLLSHDKFIVPLQTEDILNVLSTSTLQEIKTKNDDSKEFTSLNNENKTTEQKDHIKQHSLNKAEIETLENKSEYTKLKVKGITTWTNENNESLFEDHILQNNATTTKLEAEENKSYYKDFKNQENENPTVTFTSIEKYNTAEVIKKIPKIETTTYLIPESIYLPNEHKLTPPTAETENVMYDLYNSTPEEIRKESYSEVNEIITWRDQNNPSFSHDNEIMFKQKAKENPSMKYVMLKNQAGGKSNETPISAEKEITITAGILNKAIKDSSTIETGINITDVSYYDTFTYPLAVTEAVSALNQQDILLEVNTEANVMKAYSVISKDLVEQEKSELKIQENEGFNSISPFIPEEIKAEKKLYVNNLLTVINQESTQQDAVEHNYGKNLNLSIKNMKYKNGELKNRQDERSKAIPTSIAKELINTLDTVVEELHKTKTTTDVNEYLSTEIYNSDILNNYDFPQPLSVTDNKMTSDNEHVNQGNVLHNLHFANNNEVNDITPDTKYVILGDFTVIIRIKPTPSIDNENKKEQNIGTFTPDYSKNNNKTLKNITEFIKPPIYEGNVSNIKVNLKFLNDENARISLNLLTSNDSDVLVPARTEKAITTTDFGNEDSKLKNMLTIGLHETQPSLVNESVSLYTETAVDKISVKKLSVVTESPFSEEKNTESYMNGKDHTLNIKSSTTEIQHFMKKTVPETISKETNYIIFNNIVTVPPMLEDYHRTVPFTENFPPKDRKKSTIPNLDEETMNYVKDKKKIFTIPKPQLQNLKNYLEENHSKNAKNKHVITNDVFKIANTNIDVHNITKTHKMSISAQKQNIGYEDGTNTSTALNQTEKSIIVTDTLKLPEKLLLQDADSDDIQTNTLIKNPKVTRIKYPSLIYSPESYLDHRLNTKNNNLAFSHDSLPSDINDSLQKKYSKEADEVLSEFAAILNSNCNSTNKVTAPEICYKNVLANIAQGNNSLPSDDPAIVTSAHIKILKNETQKTSPVAENVISIGLTNATHSNLATYAKKMKSILNSSQYDTYLPEKNEQLHSKVLNKISSLNPDFSKKDDAFKKAIIIASAFKNLDTLFKKSDDVSIKKKTKSSNAETSSMKRHKAQVNKAPKDSGNVTVTANSKYKALHLNDSKIFYIPFISNAAVNKQTLQTSLKMKNNEPYSMKQGLALVNFNIGNTTYNNMNTARNLDSKHNKIRSTPLSFTSNIKSKSHEINNNFYDPFNQTQILSNEEQEAFEKNVNNKIIDKENVISKSKTSEELPFTKIKTYNKISKTPIMLDKTFNNSALQFTDVNLSSPPWKHERMENDNADFQENIDLPSNISKNASFNATESFVENSVSSDKQTPEDFGRYETLNNLLTYKKGKQNQSKKQITKGYVPIMTFTYTPKTSLITKPDQNVNKMSTTYSPLVRTGFDLYTAQINKQTFDTEFEKRNDYLSARNYKSNSKKYIDKSTPLGANKEEYIVTTYSAPEIVEKVTNNNSVPQRKLEKEETLLKERLNLKNMEDGKPDIYNALTNAYSPTKTDEKTVKDKTSTKLDYVVDNKYEHSAVTDDLSRIFVEATPKSTTVGRTVGSITYSILPNEAVTKSTKKMKRYRKTNHPKTYGTTTTEPQRTTARKKRRRTRKRIVYNTYEPTIYEDLEAPFTDTLRKKVKQVKPTRANSEEILGDLLKSSDHVHIGDATAILPWPLYFSTPSTTKQVNVRGKIELSHIIRQTKLKTTESASKKLINTVGNLDITIEQRPTQLPAFNTLYRNHIGATERITSSLGSHVDSVPVIVAVMGPKSTSSVNFNHYEMVTTTVPTRLLESGIHNNMETNTVPPQQLLYPKSPVYNAFTGTLLPLEKLKQKKLIYHSVSRKPEKKLTFYQGFGKIYEKPTQFPIFGDIYKRTAYTTNNVNNSGGIHDNITKTARSENNIAEDKITAFMKATRSSNMKILLFRRNDPKISKISQFRPRKVTYSPDVKRGPTAGFAENRLQLSKKRYSKIGTNGKKSFRSKFVPSKLEFASAIDTNVDFNLEDLVSSNVQKKSDLIKNVISKSRNIKEGFLDSLDTSDKTKLYPVQVMPKFKVKKTHHSIAENNLYTIYPKELISYNNNKMATARINFFDKLAKNNIKTYIVHSAKPLLSRQILLRPKFANIDNTLRITQMPPIEPIEKDIHYKLNAIDFIKNRKPVAFNLLHNKKEIKAKAPNRWNDNLNILGKPFYFPIMNRKPRIDSDSEFRIPTRGFLVPEEKYFLESPMESFREAAILMPPQVPTVTRYVTPSKPRRSRRTIYFLSPTASYIEYFK